MSICKARLHNISNALTRWMSGEQIRLRFLPKLFGVNSWIAQVIRQQGRINYLRPHTNVRRGPFSHTRSQDFLWGCTFVPPPQLTPFLVVVTFKPTLNIQTFKRQNSVKNGSWSGASWRRGPLPWCNWKVNMALSCSDHRPIHQTWVQTVYVNWSSAWFLK